MPKLIVITNSHFIANEAKLWQELLHSGADRIHIRKPGLDENTIIKMVGQVEETYRSKLVLHYNLKLASQLNLGGCHVSYGDFEKKSNEAIFNYCKIPISVSVHNWDECKEVVSKAAYTFISPVFSSISKSYYNANVSLRVVPNQFSNNKIIALGGITANNAQIALQNGYYGVAALGYLWQDQTLIFSHFEKLKNMLYNRR